MASRSARSSITDLKAPLPPDAEKGHGWPCFEERGRGVGVRVRLLRNVALCPNPHPPCRAPSFGTSVYLTLRAAFAVQIGFPADLSPGGRREHLGRTP